MAWMKIDLELPDKPEVHAIASMLNIDSDAVVGKLIRIWQWFDKHTTDGNAYGVTFALPDRISSVTGFGEAMEFVGWLEQHDKTLVMPKFDRHTSESAKARALTAKRVSEHKEKSNAKGNAITVTKALSSALPREDKIRVNNISTIPSLFVEFWNAYGKKVGKPNALKEWKKISPSDDEAKEIISAANSLRLSRPDPTFRKDPERWLKLRGWEDELPTVQSVTSDPLTEIFARAI
jgi:hypothetical protein